MQLVTAALDASEAVLAARQEIASAVVAIEFALHPELVQRHGAGGREKSLQDALYHLSFLAQSLALDRPALFAQYVAWVKVVLVRRGVGEQTLADHLGCLARVIRERIPGAAGVAAAGIVDEAIATLASTPDDIPTFIVDGGAHAGLARHYLDALLRGERREAATHVRQALAQGLPLQSLYLHVFAPAQRELGRLWQLNEISVAQEHFCSAATQLIMSQVSGAIFEGPRGEQRLVAACVAGDLHEIGLRMVADFFEMSGWRTFYLGANMPHGGVVETIVATRSSMLLVSASIGLHVSAVRDLIGLVRAETRCRGVRILVGGHPFNTDPSLWRTVGADGHAADARLAVRLSEELSAEAA